MSSPVVTVTPPSKRSCSGRRSSPASRARNVSTTARRSRCSSTSNSRPSSASSNSTLPREAGTTAGRSQTRATAAGSCDGRRATHGRGRHRLDGADREAGRHAGTLVDLRRVAHGAGEAADDLEQVRRHDRRGELRVRPQHRRLLRDERQLVVQLERVVRADLGAEAVLERGDDAPAVRVVLRVRARDHEQVQRQPQLVAAHLDVALLQHVEQRDLDALGEVGQLVDREDAAVGARDEAVVHGLGVAERAALRHLDRVDVADEVADAGVRRRQLLAEALAAVLPVDRELVALLGQQGLAARADRGVRVIVDLAAGDDRRPLVEQAAAGCG